MRRATAPAALAAALLAPCIPTQAATPDFKQPNAYAVVIGISQYREEVIPKVAYAVKDAQAVAALLEAQGGIPKTHIRLLTDSKATSADLRTIGEWLRRRVKADSTVYVYYAGHGTPNPKTGEAYLVPWDGHPDYPDGLYSLNDLYATLNKLPAKEIVVLLDSCFSGATGRSVLAKDARPMVVSVENPLLSGGKVIVLAAATGNQISSDYAKKEHGLFTLNLLRGLSLTGIGSADRNRDGFITLRELFPYVREKVASMAVEELDREQTPILLPGEDSLGERMDLKLAKAVTSLLELAFPEFNEEEKARKKTRARPFEAPRQTGREITGKDGAPMLLVPEGEFLYGDYKQRLSLPAFYMDKYEVTTKLYAAFLQGTSREKPRFWDDVSLASDGDRPVVGVTWSDADAYCRYYGKRLPTEQEWEKAARGTDGRKYPWGNKEPTGRHAKYDHDGKASWHGYATLVSVESYEAGKSPYGLYHMAGNVWEWTSSDYDSSSKVIRGGSWLADASDLWSANRVMWPPDFWTTDRGFRCVQDAPK